MRILPPDKDTDLKKLSDDSLDKLLCSALPDQLPPEQLQQQILNSVFSPHLKSTTVTLKLLNWLTAESQWWRPLSAGLATLILGYVIGLANPAYDSTDSLEFDAIHMISLSDDYEVFDESF